MLIITEKDSRHLSVEFSVVNISFLIYRCGPTRVCINIEED